MSFDEYDYCKEIICPACESHINLPDDTKICPVCFEKVEFPKKELFKVGNADFWQCVKCKTVNDYDKSECKYCGIIHQES